MPDQPYRELTITRTFDAPRELVFKAWTDPKLLSQWWGPQGVTNPECRVDLRVGGEIYVVMLAGDGLGPLAGQRWPMKGVFREIVEPEKLVFVNQAVDEAGNILIDGLTTVKLEESNGKTNLTLHVSGRGIAPQAEQMLSGMEAGWNQSLDKLGEFVKSQAA